MDEPMEMDDAERAFRDWRRSKRTKEIPEQLWARAVGVARVHGVSKTATRLRLNATRLGERCKSEARSGGFVELAASELKLGEESVVEIEDAAGSRLRVVLRGASVAAVTAAAKELWSATR